MAARRGTDQVAEQSGDSVAARVLQSLDEDAHHAGRGRILVVDDEPLMVKMLACALGAEHEVVTATSGREAIDAIEAHPRFDLVLCDVMMPDLTGIDLRERLVASHPELVSRMLFMTGGAYTDAVRRFLGQPGVEHVKKPFEPEQLLAAIEARLRAHGRA